MAAEPGLDQLSRDELIVKARSLGAKRPEVMTRIELRDEIVRLSETDPTVRRRSRGWLGVARDLVASVVDSGLNLPGAAAAIRGDGKPVQDWQGPPPVATVTLAEIYVAQGHTDRALAVLSEVLASEPDHKAALSLRDRLEGRAETSSPGTPFPATGQGNTERSALPPAGDDVAPVVLESASVGRVDVDTESWPAPTPESPRGPTTPFPDEGSPLTGKSVYPLPAVEEPTIRGKVDVYPDRAACALVAGARGVEALYELPLSTLAMVLRVVWFKARRAAPERREIDVPVEPGYHRVTIEGPEAGSEVRAALGTVNDGEFSPIAVAWVYEPQVLGLAAKFAPPGVEPSTLKARVDARIVALR